MDEGHLSRRSFFRRSSAAVVGAATATGLSAISGRANARGDKSKILASSLASVISVEGDGRLLIRTSTGSRVVEAGKPSGPVAQPDGSVMEIKDPGGPEGYAAGQELVLLEEYAKGQWRILDVQHLYRSIDPGTVTDRTTDTLSTSSETLRLTEESVPRASEDEFDAVPLTEIKKGDTVGGIGFLESESDPSVLRVAQLGARRTGN